MSTRGSPGAFRRGGDFSLRSCPTAVIHACGPDRDGEAIANDENGTFGMTHQSLRDDIAL
jgi:hypothetical protein